MIDAVEARVYISLEHLLRGMLNPEKDGAVASGVERPGLNPYELGANWASHAGSNASVTRVWRARSAIVGMPSGRCSAFPGFGM